MNHHAMTESGASNEEVAPVPASWNFAPNETLLGLTALSVRGVLGRVMAGTVAEANSGGGVRPLVQMAQADPSVFPCFRTAPEAVVAVAGECGEHNSRTEVTSWLQVFLFFFFEQLSLSLLKLYYL
jgi:tyrosine aminotransferase